jgi:hypothetical protein
MRLSNTQTLLIYFFLINFLTLFLKPDANAQTVLFANSLAYNDYRQNRLSFHHTKDNYTYNVADILKSDGEFTGVQALPAFDFRRTSETFHLQLSAYHVLKNNGKVYPGHRSIPARVYSVDLKHCARLTFKLFKLVILPLWQSK